MKIALILFKYDLPLDDPCCYPLGFMYISAVLKKAGHDVTVFNLNLEDENEFERMVGNPDESGGRFSVALFTGFESFKPSIIQYAAMCRGRGIRTLLGGALATFTPFEMLKYVDTVIVGEGENVVCQALNSTGIVQGTKPNLDDLPLPDYEGFGIEEYHRRHGTRYMGVLTSRGCPYSCKFCAQTCAFQFRNLAHVFEEIDIYKAKYGVEMIVFNDNTLNLRKDRFMSLCKGMKSRNLPWCAAIRADVWDEEMMRAAKDSGLKYLVVGVESFLQDKLDRMNKRVTVEQITRTLDMIQDSGVNYHANTLHGFPDEDYEYIINEISVMPTKYPRVFPGLVQPFIGTGYKGRRITRDQETFLDGVFDAHARNQGMAVLPKAA